MLIVKMRFYLAIEKILRYPALFFVRLHRQSVERMEKAANHHQVHELLIKMVLSEDPASRTGHL